MMATRGLAAGSMGFAPGLWRWAALGFCVLTLIAAALAFAMPASAGWEGLVLVAGIGAVGCLVLYAVWPKATLAAADAQRVAEAAARANIAWAITGADGAVLDCNPVYRRMAGAADGEAPPPPELALAGEPSSAVLYRLTRSAAERQLREESFQVAPGLEIVAAVRPLTGGETAWWFTPRLAGMRNAAITEPVSAAVPLGISAVFRDAPMGLALSDGKGVIAEANAAFAEFFGRPSLAGAKLLDLVDAAERNAVGELLAGSGSSTTEIKPLQERERIAELFVHPLNDGRVVLYLLDVSEQKALETKFAQSQKMQAVGQLAGGVAHDFNNLLTVIIGNSEFLLMRHPAGDPSFKEINEIHQNALRAATLVGQLLAFSRKQTLQPKVLGVRDVVSELAVMLKRLLREGVELELDHGTDLWPVHADEVQISNAIINLVVNARDAMPKGGTVTIRTANETVAAPLALGSAIMP
ncbi:MAG: PAS domain-containing protein, partial [Alphaproteobacteria bacterium]|nr:PAS domain-containing protein [Alphaproteobacteria bacterium]